MKFIFMRHTTTDWNIQGLFQGQADIELNELGRNEAKIISEKLLNLNISKIVTSSLKRAKQTARIINSKLDVHINIEDNLKECSFGSIEGMRMQEIQERKLLSMSNIKNQYNLYDFRSIGGENDKQVLNRHLKVIRKYYKNNSQNNILLIGHGRGLATLLFKLSYPPMLKQGEYRIVELKNNIFY